MLSMGMIRVLKMKPLRRVLRMSVLRRRAGVLAGQLCGLPRNTTAATAIAAAPKSASGFRCRGPDPLP